MTFLFRSNAFVCFVCIKQVMATSVFTIEIFVTLLTFIVFGSENQFDISIMSLLIEVLEGGVFYTKDFSNITFDLLQTDLQVGYIDWFRILRS